MNRRQFLATSVSAVSAAATARPNILLLFADQHNAGVMGCYGHRQVRTPNLDRIASEGVRFTRAYCQDGVCMPSRTALMTGQYCRTFGMMDNRGQPPQPEKFTTIMRVLRAGGYRTAAFGKRHLPRAFDTDWDVSAAYQDQKQEPSTEQCYRDWLREQGQYDRFMQDWMAEFGNQYPGEKAAPMASRISALPPEYTMEAFTARKTIEFLRGAKRNGKPFFCWASFYRPHQPYTPQKQYADQYPQESVTLPASLREPPQNLPPTLQNQRRSTRVPWCLGQAALDVNLYRQYVSYYYALVAEIDHHIGAILAALSEEGLASNTLVLYTADHGDFVAAHGMIEKCAVGHNVYEDTLRIPLLARFPGRFRRGSVAGDLVELVDIFPTLLDLSGVSKPAGYSLPGRSLAPALERGLPVGRPCAISENWSQVSVIGRRYKLGAWIKPQKDGYPDMLFDRDTDPLETGNLHGRPEGEAPEKELRAYLQEWAERTPRAPRR